MRRTKKNLNRTHTALKFRLYPNDKQKSLIEQTFHGTRKVYNALLENAFITYPITGKYNVLTQAYVKKIPGLEWLNSLDSLALANAECDLKQAFSNHFKNPAHFDLPRFKKRKREYQGSYTTNHVNGNIIIQKNALKLPKLGFVDMLRHRPLPTGYVLKSVTVSRTHSKKYYASILMVSDDIQVEPVGPRSFFGMDFRMNGLFVGTEDIEDFQYPDLIARHTHRLVKAQRNLSRCVEGSSNWEKCRLRVARIHEEIADQRRDHLHKLSTRLAEMYDIIAIEDLNIKAMARRKKDPRFFSFGRSIANNGWAMFVEMLGYKMKQRGKYLIKVDKRFPSSKLCSVCGIKNKRLRLKDRKWTCPHCQTRHDRDHNAAINIRREGIRIFFSDHSDSHERTGGRREIKPVEKYVRRQFPCSDSSEYCFRRADADSMKQENEAPTSAKWE